MDEDAVEPQEPIEQIIEEATPLEAVQVEIPEEEEVEVEQQPKKTMVPLTALQKQREKTRELELKVQWMEQQSVKAQSQAPQEDDNSRYESATKEDLNISQENVLRAVEEKLWIKQNPEKYEKVNEFLPQFLKQRPNLASAISQASNRYEEAFDLMDALTPKQQQKIRTQVQTKKEAPNAPGNVPKSTALKESVDVMGMNDSEFAAWRQSKKKHR